MDLRDTFAIEFNAVRTRRCEFPDMLEWIDGLVQDNSDALVTSQFCT